MKTTLDQAGRIELPHVVLSELGVKAGDDVLLENLGGQWVIMAAREPVGLRWRGEVLIHEGVSRQPADQLLKQIREERAEELGEGLVR